MMHDVLLYLAGVATLPVGYLLVRVVHDIPLVLRQARYEEWHAVPIHRSHLRPWVYRLLVRRRKGVSRVYEE